MNDIARASFVVAQNAKFDLAWLDRCGFDLHDILCYDTMLAEWVLLGNQKKPLNLGAMLKRRGLEGKEDIVGGMIKLGIDPLNIPKSLLKHYCLEDVRGTLELFQQQLTELKERDQLHLVYSRCLLTPVLADIEKQGVKLDSKAVYEEYFKVVEEHKQAQNKLEEYGKINWNSRQQVAGLLYDTLGFDEPKDRKGNPIRTAGGSRSTDVASLASLKPKNSDQRDFLAAYQSLANLTAKLSKTLSFFKEVVDNHNGVFYGEFNQGRTGTHRLSSSGRKIVAEDGSEYGAQLQNLPREYKKLVTAKEEGWVVVEADGSQIEFRVATDMGHDRVGYKEICEDADVHTTTAEILTKAGQKTNRQDAKPTTFRPLYGGSSGTSAEQAYCKYFRQKYDGIFKTQTEWTQEVLKTGQLRTPYGMIFYWPGTSLSRSGYITNTTAIFNYPIQGFATAEIIPIVLVYLWHRMRDMNVRLVLTVHDSVIMEVAPDVDMEALKDVIAKAFTEDVYNYLENCYKYTFVVPLGCEIKAGRVWGEGKGTKAKMFNKDRKLLWQ